MKALQHSRFFWKYVLLNCAALAIVSTVASAQEPAAKESDSGKVISGRISTDNGAISSARVTIFRFSPVQQGQAVRLDSNAAFQTKPLEPGLYAVSVYLPGLIRDSSGANTPNYYRPGDTI